MFELPWTSGDGTVIIDKGGVRHGWTSHGLSVKMNILVKLCTLIGPDQGALLPDKWWKPADTVPGIITCVWCLCVEAS